MEAHPPWLSEAHRLAILCFRRGELEQAETYLHEALTLAPGNPDLLHFLSAICLESNRVYRAREASRQVLGLRPDWAPAHNNLA
ncbi:MAG: tetratricopeptide repeat protein, partial [Candidatus Sericytochromatia bacterium]